MGIENREYMARKPDTFGTVRGWEISAVALLMIINVLVWLLWQSVESSPSFLAFMNDNFLCSIKNVFGEYRVHTLVTSAISHQDLRHIFFNMIFFWVLGSDVEAFYGRWNFILLYIFAGMAAALAQCGLNLFQGDVPMLGASGSVMGVAVAAAFINPGKPMLLMGFVPMKLWLLVVIYVIMDLSGAMIGGGRIAHAAHLGGAVAGVLFYAGDFRLFGKRRPKLRAIEGKVERTFGMLEAEKKELRESWDRPRDTARIDADTSRRVDELLAKISKEGKGFNGLSNEERDFLQKTSEKYRKP